MKRTISLLLAALLLTMTACSDSGEANTECPTSFASGYKKSEKPTAKQMNKIAALFEDQQG